MKLKFFKTILCLVFIGFLCSTSWAADKVGDFDGDTDIDINDVAYELAWISARDQSDKVKIAQSATVLVTSATGPVKRLPTSVDDVSGDDIIDINDAVYTLSWISARNQNDFTSIETSAKTLYPVTGYMSKAPGTEIGESSMTFEIASITPDL